MVNGDYVRTLALSLMFLFVKKQAARTKRMFKTRQQAMVANGMFQLGAFVFRDAAGS